MTTPARAPVPLGSNHRRVPRCPLAVPVRVTLRHASTAQAFPGRSLDLGEGGIAAVLAGELHQGDSVGVEFLLPELGLGFHAKAIVRHHAALRSGLEFMGLSLEQQAMIRRWIRRTLEAQSPTAKTTLAAADSPVKPIPTASTRTARRSKLYGRIRHILVVTLLGCLVAGAFAGWRWRQGWIELRREAVPVVGSDQRLKLSPSVMQGLLLRQEDAKYPDGSPPAPGIVLLDVVIASDGTVLEQRAVSGPERLVRAAMESVKDWRFQPYNVDGKPVEVETTLAVQFQP